VGWRTQLLKQDQHNMIVSSTRLSSQPQEQLLTALLPCCLCLQVINACYKQLDAGAQQAVRNSLAPQQAQQWLWGAAQQCNHGWQQRQGLPGFISCMTGSCDRFTAGHGV
jgi:hypothetical protein